MSKTNYLQAVISDLQRKAVKRAQTPAIACSQAVLPIRARTR